MKISKGKKKTAVRWVIYGTEGIGKSTLVSHFPDPLYIDTEAGTLQLDVNRFDEINTWTDVTDAIDYVIKNPDVCETLVLDTADRAEQMLIQDMLETDQKSSIEDYGYGKGYTKLQERFQKELLNRLDKLIAKGKQIVVIAHSKQRTVNPPDENPYDHYELKLSKNVSPLLKEWADCLLFLNYQFVVTTEKNASKGKAQGAGRRVMYCNHMPQFDAKNRFGLPDEVPMEYKSIQKIVEGSIPKKEERTVLDVNTKHEGIVDDDNPIEKTKLEVIREKLKEAGVPEEDFIALMKKKKYGEDPEAWSETVLQSVLDNIDATIKVIKKGEK